MNVLVACEESQRVCTAFREKGHRAFSCDIIECSGGHPEWHILGDVIPILGGCCKLTTMDGTTHDIDGKWDLIIAHPPCTYLSNAGAARLFRNVHDGEFQMVNIERLKKGIQGRDMLMRILNANCEHIAVENPVPSKIFCLPEASQTIQPYYFGHPFTKKTLLWLKGLPALMPTDIVEPVGPWVCGNVDVWHKQQKSGQVFGKEKDAKHRSKTFPGIAKAMADQWG